MTSLKPWLGALLGAQLTLAAAAAAPVRADDAAYTWKPVAIVGGGFVDGIAFHPGVPGLAYARTDMGGAYRRDSATSPWQPLLDHLPLADVNLMGVESLAVDPHDPDAVYLACGTYTAPTEPNGAVLRSRDRGRSWQRTDLPFKLGGNEGGRGNGERLAVDPNDGRVLYLGSRFAGLWRSTDRAASWQRVDSFPDAAWRRDASDGPPPSWGGSDGKATINFLLFDPRSGTRGQPSRTIYAGVSVIGRPSLWRSQDAGATWQPLPGGPATHRPMRAALASDGRLYIAYASEPGPHRMKDGSVWRLDPHTATWADITPARPAATDPFGYATVAVDPGHPQRLLASTAGRGRGDELFRSTDGGATWQPLFTTARFDASAAPYVADTHLHWLYDVKINSADPDHAIFTTGYGGWETRDLRAADRGQPTTWRVMSRGIEETVALALHSPTQGVPLVTAIGDYSGFVHTDLDRPAAGNPKPPFFGNTHDVTGAALAPEVIVRIGHARDGGKKNLGYSLDGGATWREPASLPPGQLPGDGFIAVSADGRAWVWTPKGHVPHVTHDRGDTWQPVQGLPAGTRVVADPVNPARFHAMALFDGQLFASTDAGLSFSARPLTLPDGPVTRSAAGSHNHSSRGDDRGGQDRLYAAPGREGELWLAAFHGLYRQRAGDSQRFERLPGVSEIHAFGFGRAAPGAANPALYLVGTVSGRYGLFRSTDAAAHWQRINDDAHQWGLILHITGDPKVFGRVYVGTHGRGVLYGDAPSHSAADVTGRPSRP
ncbi:xyloglucanase [Pelomonas sp. UHG3]|uniref:Xyloglucanase n=1 Tax=Roseateles hydrophilus TaxID=2975054 RepID=A0ACC6C9K2_9BURK|nr:sialidase family protein [Pelomonas sp. UHG3]MCY4745091.1 xyloglucanase [Pelomonas sp. UHG3]